MVSFTNKYCISYIPNLQPHTNIYFSHHLCSAIITVITARKTTINIVTLRPAK